MSDSCAPPVATTFTSEQRRRLTDLVIEVTALNIRLQHEGHPLARPSTEEPGFELAKILQETGVWIHI